MINKWTETERRKIWKLHLEEQLTFIQITERFGTTKGAISGVVFRGQKSGGIKKIQND